ncbi:hypothetical protein HGM15179_020888, partial [Zosterops borbonicus]
GAEAHEDHRRDDGAAAGPQEPTPGQEVGGERQKPRDGRDPQEAGRGQQGDDTPAEGGDGHRDQAGAEAQRPPQPAAGLQDAGHPPAAGPRLHGRHQPGGGRWHRGGARGQLPAQLQPLRPRGADRDRLQRPARGAQGRAGGGGDPSGDVGAAAAADGAAERPAAHRRAQHEGHGETGERQGQVPGDLG